MGMKGTQFAYHAFVFHTQIYNWTQYMMPIIDILVLKP